MTREIEEQNITTLLKNWTDEPLLQFRKADSGTINDVWILTTPKQRFVLRRYYHRFRERIELEHEVVNWAYEHGIPAVCPIPTCSGETYHIHEERFLTVLPFASGRQVDRKRMSRLEIREMGRFLGHMHGVLTKCPIVGITALYYRHEREATIAKIEELLTRIEAIQPKVDTDRYTIDRLRSRLTWLESRPPMEETSTETADAFPTHGDYQNTNVFFEGDTITAIIDWDKIFRAPAAWMVVRALDLMFRFSPESSQVFLDGYRQEHALTMGELDAAVEQYGIMRAYDLWLPTEIYEHGNDRVRQFVFPGRFVPMMEKWAKARPHLRIS
jgi:homoserine kinase type II